MQCNARAGSGTHNQSHRCRNSYVDDEIAYWNTVIARRTNKIDNNNIGISGTPLQSHIKMDSKLLVNGTRIQQRCLK